MQANFLRTALMLDAATCLATGVLLAAAPAILAPLLDLPQGLLFEAGLFLLPFAAFALWASRQVTRTTAPARAVMVANIAWAAGSVALVAGPWVAPNALGIAFVMAQAAAVAGLALLQYLGLKRRDMAAA